MKHLVQPDRETRIESLRCLRCDTSARKQRTWYRSHALRVCASLANLLSIFVTCLRCREGIISSDPTIGAVNHGLTSNGRAQARAAATALIEVVSQGQTDDYTTRTLKLSRDAHSRTYVRRSLYYSPSSIHSECECLALRRQARVMIPLSTWLLRPPTIKHWRTQVGGS